MTHPDVGTLPRPSIAWVERTTGSRITGLVALGGASTAQVVRADLSDRPPVVVKVFDEDFVAEEPDCAAHEAAALDVVAEHAVPAPRLLAVDANGAENPRPALLTTMEPGRHATDVAVEELARTAASIAEVDAPGFPWRYAPYFTGHELVVPAWSDSHHAWETVLAAAESAAPRDTSFVHRDFHPWNVLAEGGRTTAVVDWVAACRGPWEIDVAHCRLNLVTIGRRHDADRYVSAYEGLTGRNYQPLWDALGAADRLPHYDGRRAVDEWRGLTSLGLRLDTAGQRAALDTFVAETARHLA